MEDELLSKLESRQKIRKARLMSPRAQAWMNNVMWGLSLSVEQAERYWLAISCSDGYKTGQLDTYNKLFNAIKELHDKAQRPL